MGTRRIRLAYWVAAVLSAGGLLPAAAEEAPDGVALVDSCGTYVRMREGAETYQASQLERTQLCSNVLWSAAEALKARTLGADEEIPTKRRAFVRCATDPRAMGPHQSVRVAYRYLTEHPERLHFGAEQLAKEALEDAFGCEPANE